MSVKIDRLNHAFVRELSYILLNEVKDDDIRFVTINTKWYMYRQIVPAHFRNQTHRSEFAVYPHTVNHGPHSFALAFFAVKRSVAALGAEGVFIHSKFKFGVNDRYIGCFAVG